MTEERKSFQPDSKSLESMSDQEFKKLTIENVQFSDKHESGSPEGHRAPSAKMKGNIGKTVIDDVHYDSTRKRRGGASRTSSKALDGERSYSKFGLLCGMLCIICGVVLLLCGVTGQITWSAEVLGFTSKVVDASPGIILIIAGVIIIRITRYDVKVRNLRE